MMKNKLFTKIFSTTLFLLIISLISIFVLQNYIFNRVYISYKLINLEHNIEETAEYIGKFSSPSTTSIDIKNQIENTAYFNRTVTQLYSDDWTENYNWVNNQLLSESYIIDDKNIYRIGFDKYTNQIFQISILEKGNRKPIIDDMNNLSLLKKMPSKFVLIPSSNENAFIHFGGDGSLSVKVISPSGPSPYEYNSVQSALSGKENKNSPLANISGEIIIQDTEKSINWGASYMTKYLKQQINQFIVNEKLFPINTTTVIKSVDEYTSTHYTLLIRPTIIKNKIYYLVYFTVYDNINYLSILNRLNIGTLVNSIIVSVILSLVYTKYITDPILKIRHSAKSFANLDFDAKCDINTGDELEDLSNDINFMAKQLKENISNISNELEHVKDVERFRKMFITAASHEFRTPITIMRGIVEGYRDGIFESSNFNACKNIEHEIFNLETIVNEIIAISKIESNTMLYTFDYFQLSDLVQINFNRYSYILENRNIKVNKQLDDGFIFGDEDKINIVINNILSNSIKLAPDNTTLFLNVISLEDRLVFTVENQGERLDESIIKDLWEPFYNDSQNNRIQSFGIGLYTSRLILSKHESKFEIYNTDSGIKFYCDFPIANE